MRFIKDLELTDASNPPTNLKENFMKKDYKVKFDSKKMNGKFGRHSFKFHLLPDAVTNLYPVFYRYDEPEWGSASKTVRAGFVQSHDEFVAMMNECHSVYLSGLGTYQ